MQYILVALRQFKKRPGFVTMIVLTLALGIGANTAIFTLMYSVLLRSLPVSDPRMLYRVGANTDEGGEADGYPDQDNTGDFSLFSYELYRHIERTTPEFTELAAMEAPDELMSVRRLQQPARAERTEFISGNYFQTLGVGAFAGRMLSRQDDTAGSAPAVVMSYATWQADYASDAGVVGESFTFQGHPFTLAGIAPAGFYGDRIDAAPPAFWIPLADEPMLRGNLSVLKTQNANWLFLLGRVKPGANPEGIAARISTNLRQWLATVPAYNANGESALIARQHVALTPGGKGIQNLQQQQAKGLYLLSGICSLVLLVACANVANLLLARGTSQRADLALRMALGAPRRRLISQMLTESVLLACMGGLAGLVLAYAGTHVILSLAFPDASHLPINASPSLAVLGFAFVLSLITGVVFGVVPAWITSHANPAEALRGVNRSTHDRASLPQRCLIIFQAALSLVLLLGAGLLTRSLANLQDQDLGIQTENRYVAHIDPLAAGYTAATVGSLYDELQQRLGGLPGVAHVGLGIYSPLENNEWSSGVYISGRPDPGVDAHNSALYDRVSPQFFSAIGETLIGGRVFSTEDTKSSQGVAVVNQAFVKKFFPDGNAIGHYFGTEEPKLANSFEIVGVVADAKYGYPQGNAQAMFFRPLMQEMAGLSTPSETAGESRSMIIGAIVLEFKTPQTNVDQILRRTLAEINPNLTVIRLQPFETQVRGNFNSDRLLARLALLFGVLALVLSAVGLYGITAYQVSRRTSEIGVRMALGATRESVLWMVLRGALLQVGLGIAIGGPIAVVGARLLGSQLYKVRTYDPLSLSLAVAALIVTAVIAAVLPARRAANTEPVIALRAE